MSQGISGSMVPISGRIEDDLYQWFIALQFDGAKTNSDKLREALKELKQQHDGATDIVTAQRWFQNLSAPLRQQLSIVDRDEHAHSEVMSALLDHVTAMAATVIASRPQTGEEAARIEEQLVRRAFAMTEALLRQAVTPSAAAFDSSVVRRHCGRTVELATLINTTTKGEKNG
jgi:hypothetical protein